ncbi:MAG: hypothetical protein ACYTHJ_04520 [Planctomycetota bacterium]
MPNETNNTICANLHDLRIHVRLPKVDDFPTICDIANWATLHTVAKFKLKPVKQVIENG